MQRNTGFVQWGVIRIFCKGFVGRGEHFAKIMSRRSSSAVRMLRRARNKVHRLLEHSTYGSRVITEEET